MEARYNVVFVGKTGTGKSSLINYLYGEKKAAANPGRPVTPKGFQHYDYEINGLPVSLFDSQGLEVGKENEWMISLEEELEKRDTRKSADEWFHSAFYCIQGGGHRIEDFDIDIIRQFIKANYKIAVILTKADLLSDDEEKTMKDQINKNVGQVPIIPVCSEKKVIRGRISEPFGKIEIENQAYNDFWDSIILRLPSRCKNIIKNKITIWRTQQKAFIISQLKDGMDQEKIHKDIKKSADKLVDDISRHTDALEEIQNTLTMYGKFSSALGYPPVLMEQHKIIKAKLPDYEAPELFSGFFDGVATVVLFPAIIVYGIFDYIFGDNEYEKEQLDKLVDTFTNKCLGELDKIEPYIRNILQGFKDEKTSEAYPKS